MSVASNASALVVDTVPSGAWLDDDEVHEDVELVEQVVRMPKWGRLLSVITVSPT